MPNSSGYKKSVQTKYNRGTAARNIEGPASQNKEKKMKKIFYTFMTIAAAISVAGCAKELEEAAQTPGTAPEEESGYIVLGASLPDSDDPAGDTKTTISKNEGQSSYSVFWAEGDAISVNGERSKPANIDPANKKNASFTLPASVNAPFCAVYPAGAYMDDTYSHTDLKDSLNITVPATQKYVENGIDPESAIMLAYSSDGKTLNFRHAMAYLKLTVNTAVKSVRINGNYNDAISGEFTAKREVEGSSLTFAPKKDKDGKAKGNTSITYSATDAVPVGTPMFIAIPASTYSKGLTLTIIDSENHYQVIKSTNSFTASRGKVYPTSVDFNSQKVYVEGGIYTVEDWNNFIQDLNAGDCSKWVTTIGSEKGIHIMADIECQTNLAAAKNDVVLDNIVYGQNHTIKHNPVCPLFASIGKNGGVFNLTIDGACDQWDDTECAGIFASENYGQLRKCINRVEQNFGKASGDYINVAGICCTNNGVVADCENYGSIIITEPDKDVKVGGILLYNGGTFARCKNYGRIEITGVNVGCVVGGIAYASNGAVATLENNGEISIDAKLTAIKAVYLGGVLANAEYDNKCSKLTNCKNSGSLSIHKTGDPIMSGGAVGGVVAAINKGVPGTEGDTFTGLSNCSNTGSISFVEEQSNGDYGYAIGGVVGRCVEVSLNHYGKTGYYTVIRQDCSNEGEIKVYSASGVKLTETISGARETYVGGLAGYVSGYYVAAEKKAVNAIVRGVNNGNIVSGSAKGSDVVGGLVGGGSYLKIEEKPSVETTISKYSSDCQNGFVGAVLGWTTNQGDASISNANASVTIEQSMTPIKSGFAGVTGGKKLTITGCKYNGKAVTTADIYGGGTKSVN